MEIVEVNEAFLKKMGLHPDEVVGRKCHEIFQNTDHPCDHGDFACPLSEVVRHEGPLHQVRCRLKPDGERRYIEVSTFPIWEKNGRISKFVEISRDVTKRKREEEEITRRLEGMVQERTRQLKETHAKLLHKDKMASLGKLSASVVHEINNPIAGTLNLILLMKRVIQEGPVTDGELVEFQRYLDLMEAENRRISGIVSNLLAFSRHSKMEPKRLDLNRLIDRTLLLNANLLKLHGVEPRTRLHPGLPEIVGSDDQLQQVFMNFISNAAEAMEPKGGGVLNVTTKHLPKTEKISVSFKDTGVGIPKENIPKLFEPFFTTKKKGKGVGLGLSVAYGIVQDHGGAIRVSSNVGKGTTFRVEFPLGNRSDQPDHGGDSHG
jgi:PAS domain S-box-containing protein